MKWEKSSVSAALKAFHSLLIEKGANAEGEFAPRFSQRAASD
jgi:hypothetical protein